MTTRSAVRRRLQSNVWRSGSQLGLDGTYFDLGPRRVIEVDVFELDVALDVVWLETFL